MRRVNLCVVAALLLLAPSVALAQAATPKLEEIIPDHTFAVLSLTDVDSARAQCGRTALAKLWNEPEMREFMAPAMKFLARQIKKAERQLGHPILGLLDTISGQVAVAIVEFDPMTMGMIPDAVLLVDFGENRAEFQRVHDKALDDMGGQLALEELEYKGVKYQSLTVQMGIELSVAYLGNALVITSLPDRMTAMIDAWKEGSRTSLAESPGYRRVSDKVGGGSAFMSAFLNVESVMDTFGGMMDPEMARMADETGLSGVKALGYGAKFVGEGVRDTFYAYVPGEKKGLVKLMYTAPGDATTLLSRVPKNAFYASAFGLDLHRAGEIVLDTVGSIQPYVLDQVLGMLAQAEDFLGLDIREDLLKPFGSLHALYAALPEGGGLVPDLVFLSKLRQPERFLESLGQVVTKLRMFVEDDGNYEVSLRQMSFMGKTIYYIYVTHKWGDPFPVTPACVLDGDIMAFALLPQTVKDWVARGAGAPSILESPDFVRARQGLPEDLPSLEYVDFPAGVRLLYGTLAPIAQMAGKARKCPMDMALLPRTETVAKHLFGGIWGMKAADDGVVIHAYSPTGMMPLMLAGAGMAAGMLMYGGVAEPPRVAVPLVPRRVEEAPEGPRVAPPEPQPVEPPKPEPVRLRGAKAALEEIYIALLFHYAQTDEYAGSLGELVKSQALEGPGTLQMAEDRSAPKVDGYPCSFVYVGPAVGNILDQADQAVWVYLRDEVSGPKRWVLFASGEVKQVPEAEFQKLLAGTKKMLAK
jgi:hypothetical protein